MKHRLTKAYRKVADDLSFGKEVIAWLVGTLPLTSIVIILIIIASYAWQGILSSHGHPIHQAILENILADCMMSAFTLVGVQIILRANEKHKNDEENLWAASSVDFEVHLAMAALLREWEEPSWGYSNNYIKYEGISIEEEFKSLADNTFMRRKTDWLNSLSIESASTYLSHARHLNTAIKNVSEALSKVRPSPDWMLVAPLWNNQINIEIAIHNTSLVLRRADIEFIPTDLDQITYKSSDTRWDWAESDTKDGYQWHGMVQKLRLSTQEFSELLLEIARRSRNSTLSVLDSDDRSDQP